MTALRKKARDRRMWGTAWFGGGSVCLRRGAEVACLAALAFSGCGGPDQTDPATIRKALELELTALADEAEYSVLASAGVWALEQDLRADVLQESYPLTEISNWGVMSWTSIGWYRARKMALDVEQQIVSILGTEEAETFSLTAQVRWTRALSELYLGMTFCAADLDGRTRSDTQLLQHAERSLSSTIESARAAGRSDYLSAALAARAQARMLLEDWAGAESDGIAVPAGFSYNSHRDAVYYNPFVDVFVSRRIGFLHKWWPQVEESDEPGFMIDPWSGEPDRRIPVYHDGSTLRDGVTPNYRPLKYDSLDDDVPIVHYDMAQLIVAEARAVRGDRAGATAVLNELRAAVGLPPHDVPTTAEEMEELILWERFAELHLEGQRLIDLHRKGLMEEVFEELNDPERPGVGRPSKWGDC
ncbi:MAG: RagB/SusD family nutrient uptake outer membrane protein [Gemmatimonadetes bacterium]|nr:RagB/SusD family nutrient uptake outer membrane protein [Gemmatimonadota bacterium]MYB98387.1 RagB/SusD family nutrient uptake outer membrane protein [Gemmatimonadota bacterium]